MSSYNRVILIGNLTRDPELRYTPGGTPVCTLRLAINRPYLNQQGERKTDFLNVIAWRKQAEKCAEYLSKGRSVAVEGRLQTRDWEGPDGQRRYAVDVVADRVVFLGRRERAEDEFFEAGYEDFEEPIVEENHLPDVNDEISF